ncbi:uncharacterized protein RMCC_5198 [Mycolicibacterium canariasense]|uniref:Uncharacterized protein n=1 Tax=Mycolicibacterium canariasense TaxID=228230 RepID=A0A100WHQ1_MYCCR|nr:uncharacterized protein RMCC_5198 [Mycolicibacterium canariasense]
MPRTATHIHNVAGHPDDLDKGFDRVPFEGGLVGLGKHGGVLVGKRVVSRLCHVVTMAFRRFGDASIPGRAVAVWGDVDVGVQGGQNSPMSPKWARNTIRPSARW